jgi:hypothetical protein
MLWGAAYVRVLVEVPYYFEEVAGESKFTVSISRRSVSIFTLCEGLKRW